MTLSSWPKPWRRYFCRRLPRCPRRRWNCYPQFLKAKVANPQRAARAQVQTQPGTGDFGSCPQGLTHPPGLAGEGECGLTVRAVGRKVWDVWVMLAQGCRALCGPAFVTPILPSLQAALQSGRQCCCFSMQRGNQSKKKQGGQKCQSAASARPWHGSLCTFGFIQLTLASSRDLDSNFAHSLNPVYFSFTQHYKIKGFIMPLQRTI